MKFRASCIECQEKFIIEADNFPSALHKLGTGDYDHVKKTGHGMWCMEGPVESAPEPEVPAADFNSDGFYPLESPHFPEKPDLRDTFASYALMGMLAQGDWDRYNEKNVVSAVAYEFADAMMAARKAKRKETK